MKASIPSIIALSIIAVIAYFHDWSTPKTEAPVIEIAAPVEAPAPAPGPFLYAEAVIPHFVPVPKPRPHRRHLAKLIVKAPAK